MYLIAFIQLGCWIFTVVKAFQSGETTMGVVCLCPCIAFIVGWVKSQEWDHMPVMLIWSLCVAANIVIRIAASAMVNA